MKTLTAYSDGSYDKKNHVCSFGVILIDNDIKKDTPFYVYAKKIEEYGYCNMRNVGGELLGAIYAMKYAVENNYDVLELYHDYSGIREWATEKWKTNNRYTENYKEYYKSIKDKIQINFHLIKGHTDIEGNELADKMAKYILGLYEFKTNKLPSMIEPLINDNLFESFNKIDITCF